MHRYNLFIILKHSHKSVPPPWIRHCAYMYAPQLYPRLMWQQFLNCLFWETVVSLLHFQPFVRFLWEHDPKFKHLLFLSQFFFAVLKIFMLHWSLKFTFRNNVIDKVWPIWWILFPDWQRVLIDETGYTITRCAESVVRYDGSFEAAVGNQLWI